MSEHVDETPDPTAEQRRAELPGLGYSGKFDHGDTDEADPATLEPATAAEPETAEDDEETQPPSSSPATTTPPPPSAQPWTLGQSSHDPRGYDRQPGPASHEGE